MTDLEKRQIEDLRKQGNGYKKIAQLTGLSLNTVKSFCRRIGTVSSSQCMQCGKEITQVKGRKAKYAGGVQFCEEPS